MVCLHLQMETVSIWWIMVLSRNWWTYWTGMWKMEMWQCSMRHWVLSEILQFLVSNILSDSKVSRLMLCSINIMFTICIYLLKRKSHLVFGPYYSSWLKSYLHFSNKLYNNEIKELQWENTTYKLPPLGTWWLPCVLQQLPGGQTRSANIIER